MGIPGRDASPAEVLATTLEAVLLSLMALDNPEIDAILAAYGMNPVDPGAMFFPDKRT